MLLSGKSKEHSGGRFFFKDQPTHSILKPYIILGRQAMLDSS